MHIGTALAQASLLDRRTSTSPGATSGWGDARSGAVLTEWYATRQYELHVFDPADVASVLAGSLPPWALRPVSDARTSTLYSMGYWAGTPPTKRLYAFAVGR